MLSLQFIITMALLVTIILFALAGLAWIAVRYPQEIEDALEQAQRELDARPRVGSVTNHMNNSGERVRTQPLAGDRQAFFDSAL